MKERLKQIPPEPIYYEASLDLTHIFETVIKVEDYKSLFCEIENERAGYTSPCWCFLYGETNKKIEDKKKFQTSLTKTLHTLILEAMPHYLDENLAERKEKLKHEMITHLKKISSKKRLEEHWHKFVPANMKAEMSIEEWLKGRQEDKVVRIKENKETIIAYKNRAENLQQEISDEKFAVVVNKANLVEFRLRLPGLGDPLHHSFMKFLEKHQIKGTGLMPGGWFDAHRPGAPNNFTPVSKNENNYNFFLKQVETYENSLKLFRERISRKS